MKKKKLKKKIKKLEKKVEEYCSNLSALITQTDASLTKKIMNLSDAYTNRFNKFNPDDIKNIVSRLDANRFSIDDIYEKLGILKMRTETDYTSFSKKEEKTCDTCKWEALMEQGGQDIPCMGCTADDKKMWKSKES